MVAKLPRGWFAPLVVIAAAVALGAIAYAVNRAGAPPVAPEPATTAAEPSAALPAIAEPTPVEAPAPAEAPSFDVVRVEPDGSALVAGTAAPGSEVTIYAGSEPIATATADEDGSFVAIFDAEPSAEPRALTLGEGGRRSEETVMLLPEAPEPAANAPATPGETEVAAAPTIAATAIVGAESVEVLPAPGSGGDVTLGSISYAETGAITLAGVGTAGSALRAYVDDRLAKEVTVGADGRWSFALDDVAAGLYTLRIDEIAPDGKVASRVETPFQRDFPRPPPPRPDGGGAPGGPAAVPPGGSITVQPGNNLWTLARLHYGSGVLYTQIYTANQDLIRDPDMIYPGQIFTMPGTTPADDPATAPRE